MFPKARASIMYENDSHWQPKNVQSNWKKKWMTHKKYQKINWGALWGQNFQLLINVTSFLLPFFRKKGVKDRLMKEENGVRNGPNAWFVLLSPYILIATYNTFSNANEESNLKARSGGVEKFPQRA